MSPIRVKSACTNFHYPRQYVDFGLDSRVLHAIPAFIHSLLDNRPVLMQHKAYKQYLDVVFNSNKFRVVFSRLLQ